MLRRDREVREKKHMKRHAWDTWAVKTEKDNLDGLGHEMDGLLPYLGPIWESLETSQYEWKVTLFCDLFVHGSGAEHNCGWSKTGDFQWYLLVVWMDLINPTWVITSICVKIGGSSRWLFLNLLQTQQHDQDFVYTTLMRFVQNIFIFQLSLAW